MNLLDKIKAEHINEVADRLAKDGKNSEVIKEEFLKRKKSFSIGDTVKVYFNIVEGEKERVQIFEGYVIAERGKGLDRTIKVRKISFGVGVERTFLVYSPRVIKVECVKKGKVRRAKLFYLRDLTGKNAIIREKIDSKKRQS
jgi:large subunit ribosomal protein L19